MEKKMLVIYLCLCLLVISFVLVPDNNIIGYGKTMKNDAEYIFHTLSIPSEVEQSDVKIVQNGNGYIIKCNQSVAKKIKPLLTIQGESVRFKVDSKQEVMKIIDGLNVDTVMLENIDGIYTFYGYNKMKSNLVYINNQKVNIELAYKDGIVTIGLPIILGDY